MAHIGAPPGHLAGEIQLHIPLRGAHHPHQVALVKPSAATGAHTHRHFLCFHLSASLFAGSRLLLRAVVKAGLRLNINLPAGEFGS